MSVGTANMTCADGVHYFATGAKNCTCGAMTATTAKWQAPATRKYDSTVARIAGNLLSGVFDDAVLSTIGEGRQWRGVNHTAVVCGAVEIARLIVAETKRQEDSQL